MYCRKCEYPLPKTDEGTCPECGTRFELKDPTSFRSEPETGMRSREYLFGVIMAVAFAGLLAHCYRTHQASWLIMMMLSGLPGLPALFVGIALLKRRPSRWIRLVALTPTLLMLGLFYSLALNMYRSLGGWPKSIGIEGFSPILTAHAECAAFFFSIMILANLFLFPLVVVICICIRQGRRWLYALGLYATCWALGNGLIALLTPEPFLSWWWD